MAMGSYIPLRWDFLKSAEVGWAEESTGSAEIRGVNHKTASYQHKGQHFLNIELHPFL